jgi:hypothetical protein
MICVVRDYECCISLQLFASTLAYQMIAMLRTKMESVISGTTGSNVHFVSSEFFEPLSLNTLDARNARNWNDK